MHETVSRYIKGCTMCAKSKPNNRKLGLYTPLLVPSHPWESVSMDFVGGLPKSRKGHDYLYVIVDKFSKMCILIPCNKQITVEQTMKLFFQNVWVHFGLPTSIVSGRDSRFVVEVLVSFMGVDGHQVEEKHKISSTSKWSDKSGQQDSDTVASRILQQASQTLG